MTIELTNKAKLKLLTGGKICNEDIIIDPILQDLVISENGEYVPDEGYVGIGTITVGVEPTLEEVTIVENGEYTPTEDGFSKVTVAIPVYDGETEDV